MAKIRTVFEIGAEVSTPMKYLGININQDQSKITFNQQDYIEDANIVAVGYTNDKNHILSKEEQYSFRAICGQLNWISS